MQRIAGGAFAVPQADPTSATYCTDLTQEATVYTEVNLLNRSDFRLTIPGSGGGSTFSGDTVIETDFAVGFYDRGASIRGGVIPNGTPVRVIARSYAEGVTALSGAAELVGRSQEATSECGCHAALFTTDAQSFLHSEALQAEVFGSSSLIVRCADFDEMRTVTQRIEGQLTATVHADDSDLDEAATLLPMLELKAGRILFGGWPTGVEVCHAMVHGGPFPATSDSRSTSVGSRAIERFLRPVSYQNIPNTLLPNAIADGNPDHLWRRIDGHLTQD